jgi:hypothetical protein
VAAHDRPADGQAEAGAALQARVRGVDLLGLLEDLRQLLGRDAAALVRNRRSGSRSGLP